MIHSKFERLSDEALIRYLKYAKKLFDQVDHIWMRNIEGFYQFFSGRRDSYESIRKQLMSPLGKEFDRLDIEYLYYLLDNSDLETNSLRRPKLVGKSIEFITEEKITVKTTRYSTLETFIPQDLNSGYLWDLRSDGEIEPYDWKETNREETDWDQIDDWFDL